MRRPWQSLFGRLMAIWLLGMMLVLGISLGLFFSERGRVTRNMLHEHMARDVAFAVDLLEGLPAAERRLWLPRLDRRSYRYRLETLPADAHVIAGEGDAAVERLRARLGARPMRVAARLFADGRPQPALHIELSLRDGMPLLIELTPPPPPGTPRSMLAALAALIVGVCLLTWLAVRIATRPLSRLSEAAHALGENIDRPPLAEEGATEVRDAAAAFNRMQARIRSLFAERAGILAAVSHDLQTPITRMRLRLEMSEAPELRERMLADLDAMQALVEEGLAYAASISAPNEPEAPTDVDALVAGMVADDQDAGRPVRVRGAFGRPLRTRARTLRRLLGNLIDNAIKFGDEAEIELSSGAEGQLIVIRDRGPGIPEAEIENVFTPFYRLEASRNRDTGGTGLGLAIARQLAASLGAELKLRNRPDGGLEARLRLRDTA